MLSRRSLPPRKPRGGSEPVAVLSGVSALGERLSRLDAPISSLSAPLDAPSLLSHFAEIMGSITHTQLTAVAHIPLQRAPELEPRAADEAVASSRLLEAISAVDQALTSGPLPIERQHWIAIARPSAGESLDGILDPVERRFIPVSPDYEIPPSPKPFNVGLYTSTAPRGAPSMWRSYLATYYDDALFPLPWRVWRLRPRAGEILVREIATADQWAHFIDAYGILHGEYLYPDWRAAAAEYDAVHLTARAVVALQGFSLRTPRGLTAPTYWDLETTFWMKWCFNGAELVEVVSRRDEVRKAVRGLERGAS